MSNAVAESSLPAELGREIAAEVYVWGYPLVLMDRTRQVSTNYAEPSDVVGRAPVNRISHAKEFPPASFRDVVRPNFDTLYSVAWFDLGAEPMVLTLPRTDRYHVFQLMDGWSEVFAAPGTRMTGGVGGSYLLAGPRWDGETPAAATLLRSPTDIVWMVGRIQTNGPSDYEFVHRLQTEVTAAPLSQRDGPEAPSGGAVDPSVDMKTPPMIAVDNMDGEAFFSALMEALKKNPPHVHDQGVVARMRRLGLQPGERLDYAGLSSTARAAIDTAPADGLAVIRNRAQHLGTVNDGWMLITSAIGYFGGDYALRAATALIGLGANRPEDAMYPLGHTDTNGDPFNGANRYRLRFPKGQTPPVDAFWSLTLYDDEGFPVENPIDRHAIGDRDNLIVNRDGSTDIYIQHTSSGTTLEANWLPAPDGAFTLALRLYSPQHAATNGAWTPAGIQKIE